MKRIGLKSPFSASEHCGGGKPGKTETGQWTIGWNWKPWANRSVLLTGSSSDWVRLFISILCYHFYSNQSIELEQTSFQLTVWLNRPALSRIMWTQPESLWKVTELCFSLSRDRKSKRSRRHGKCKRMMGRGRISRRAISSLHRSPRYTTWFQGKFSLF